MKKVGKLEITLPSDREIAMTRAFNAPRAMVFHAWTTPELVRRWMGAFAGWTMPVCDIDLRVGGTYRFLWRNTDTEMEMGMGGVYREIVVPERIVATEKYDDAWYEGDAVVAVTLTEEDGRTTLVETVTYASKEVRDAVLQSPMETGVAAGFDRLEEILAS
ncbi:MAG TPA: SRPBCC family protein [Thermoanaerobaculia bacterium]|nr:SRPBCC family protein [Thermoanaerobaculia bacterium]